VLIQIVMATVILPYIIALPLVIPMLEYAMMGLALQPLAPQLGLVSGYNTGIRKSTNNPLFSFFFLKRHFRYGRNTPS
jgi:hypothetical protein